MKCQRVGCNNHKKGSLHFRKAYVTDKRTGKPKRIKRDEEGNKVYHNNNPTSPVFSEDREEMWCLVCAGAFEPEQYRMVYFTEGNQTKQHRVPLEKELVKSTLISPPELIAPIIESPAKEKKSKKTSAVA